MIAPMTAAGVNHLNGYGLEILYVKNEECIVKPKSTEEKREEDKTE